MRQIVLDTETTGLDPASGDRVIEVAAIEIFNFLPTGGTFHRVIDPERDVPEESTRVHGFTYDMLRGKPRFADIAEEMLAFIGPPRSLPTTRPSISASWMRNWSARGGRSWTGRGWWTAWTSRGGAFPAR